MTNKYYPTVQSNVDFPTIEKKILAYWQKNNIFQKNCSRKYRLFQNIFSENQQHFSKIFGSPKNYKTYR